MRTLPNINLLLPGHCSAPVFGVGIALVGLAFGRGSKIFSNPNESK